MLKRIYVKPSADKKVEKAINAWGADARHDPIYLYLKEVGHEKLLTFDEEQLLAEKASKGDIEARNTLVTKNLRLVIKVARQYLYRGLQLGDLIDEGNLGLMHAIDKFEYDRGLRLSTYATWWIKESIERAIMNCGRTIRLPIHIVKGINRLKRAERSLVQALDREPTMKELAEELECTPEEVDKLLQANQNEAVNELYLENTEEARKIDTQCYESTDLQENLSTKELHDYILVDVMQKNLSESEQDILIRRFGLFGQSTETLDHIGQTSDMTREHVRQVQIGALKSLRQKLEAEGLSPKNIFGE